MHDESKPNLIGLRRRPSSISSPAGLPLGRSYRYEWEHSLNCPEKAPARHSQRNEIPHEYKPKQTSWKMLPPGILEAPRRLVRNNPPAGATQESTQECQLSVAICKNMHIHSIHTIHSIHEMRIHPSNDTIPFHSQVVWGRRRKDADRYICPQKALGSNFLVKNSCTYGTFGYRWRYRWR